MAVSLSKVYTTTFVMPGTMKLLYFFTRKKFYSIRSKIINHSASFNIITRLFSAGQAPSHYYIITLANYINRPTLFPLLSYHSIFQFSTPWF